MSVPTPCYRSGAKKDPVTLSKVHVAFYTDLKKIAYSLDPIESEWADYAAVQA